MDNDRFLHALGLSARAGKLSCGHDAVKDSVRRHRARLIVFSEQASARLRDEMKRLSGDGVAVLEAGVTNEDIAAAVGKRAGVLSVNDKGLAELVISAYGG